MLHERAVGERAQHRPVRRVLPFLAFAPVGTNPVDTARVEYHHEGDTIVVCFGSDSCAIDGCDLAAVQRALRTFVPDRGGPRRRRAASRGHLLTCRDDTTGSTT